MGHSGLYKFRTNLLTFTLTFGFAWQNASAETVFLSNDEEAFSFEVLSSDAERSVLRLRVNHFETEDVEIQGQPFTQLSLIGATSTDQKGWPELPKINRNLAIPFSSKPSVRILSLKTEVLSLGQIAPSKGDIERSVDPSLVPYTLSSFYRNRFQRSRIFPSSYLELSSPFVMRDLRGVTVNFRPFQFNARTEKTTVVTEMVVELRTATPANSPFKILANPSEPVNVFSELYRSRFANGVQFEAEQSALRIDHRVKEDGKILIITDLSFANGLAPFVAWKRQRGYDVSVKTLAETGTTAKSIKAFIQKQYDTDNKLAFVILVGDAQQLPFYPGTRGNAVGKEADPMYGLVAGNDNYPDLIVARFSVQTSADLDNIVARSVNYERDPEVNGTWYRKGLGIASDEGSPKDWERADVLRTMMEAAVFSKVDRVYDPSANPSTIASALNDGRGFINYIGHGAETGWISGRFENKNIDSLQNGRRLPVIISVACVNGAFNYKVGDSFAERWLKAGTAANPRGALAIFASSTNQSWVPPTVGQKEIVRLMTQGDVSTVGGLMMNGSVAVLEDASETADQTFQTWHIFGDPTIQVRTKAPVKIQASVPEMLESRALGLSVKTDSKGLNVTVMDGDFVLARGTTGLSGALDLDFGSATIRGNSLNVTISGLNRIPFERRVTIFR